MIDILLSFFSKIFLKFITKVTCGSSTIVVGYEINSHRNIPISYTIVLLLAEYVYTICFIVNISFCKSGFVRFAADSRGQ